MHACARDQSLTLLPPARCRCHGSTLTLGTQPRRLLAHWVVLARHRRHWASPGGSLVASRRPVRPRLHAARPPPGHSSASPPVSLVVPAGQRDALWRDETLADNLLPAQRLVPVKRHLQLIPLRIRLC